MSNKKKLKQTNIVDKNKKALLNFPSKTKKQIGVQPNFNTLPIGWNFKYVELENSIFRCSFKDFLKYSRDIVDRFEEKSLVDISQETDHSHSWDNATKLHPELQKIFKQKHIDQELIYQLQMNSKFRIWGFVRLNIFHVVCFDYEHKGYKTYKRHT